jgi:hypothetical protein
VIHADEVVAHIQKSSQDVELRTLIARPGLDADERWNQGEKCYFTLDFLDDYSGNKKPTIGTLV